MLWKENPKATRKYCESLGMEMNVRGFFHEKAGDFSAYGHGKNTMVYYDAHRGQLEFHLKALDNYDGKDFWLHIATYYFSSEEFISSIHNYEPNGTDHVYYANPNSFNAFFDENDLY
jgi:hypothetical protein